jgi:rhodanese-related sulfurtransferase
MPADTPMKKYLHLLLLPVLLLAACTSSAQQQDLSPAQFEQATTKAGVQILDVRTQEEYAGGHLRNAVLADWTARPDFIEKTKTLDKDKPVYTYCRSGRRSAAAADWLRENGFREVYNMAGGIEAWKEAEKRVE